MKIFSVVLFMLYCFHHLQGSHESIIVTSNEEESLETSDYYWRDYNGVIPSDALPGGIDRSGNPTYIGQIPYRGPRLLPATIYKDCNTAHSTVYGKEITEDKNVKILCSRNQHRYSWIPTRFEDFHLLTACQLVVGGMEKEHTLYVGRVYHDRKTRIGKIFDPQSSYQGLAIPYRGKEIKYMSFEVLAYNCSVNQLCNLVDADVGTHTH